MPGWVHYDICARLERFYEQTWKGKSPRLMLLVPPRHGKSTLASINFPAWVLGRNSGTEIINVGYNMDLPMIFSRKVRALLREPSYTALFPETQLATDSQSVESWSTTRGGSFLAVGVGGGVTGKGAHILTIDDPIKNQEEADSILIRDKLWDWYQSTAYTRLAPGGGVLLIQTWWHDDDLAGRLQNMMKHAAESDRFEIVKYPAISEGWEYRVPNTLEIVRSTMELDPPPGEVLRRPREALHPERYPLEALERIKNNLQPRIWSALYQQNPVPDEGAYFKKEYFRFQTTMPTGRDMRIYMAWDFAIGEKQQNDWNVGAVVAQDADDTLYVLEIIRFKGDTFQIVNEVLDTYDRWGKIGTGFMAGFEDGQIWKTMRPFLQKRMHERRLYFPYEELKPFTDKMVRARPLQGRMQHQKVVFPQNAPWKDQAVNELLRFPAGVHDDVVDALAWVVHLCLAQAPPQGVTPVKLESWRDRIETLGALNGSHMAA